MTDFNAPISRRRALALGGTVAAGGLALAATPLTTGVAAASPRLADPGVRSTPDGHQGRQLPTKQIEDALQAQGTMANGVFTVEIDRTDLDVTLNGNIPFKPAWQSNGDFVFQALGDGRAIMNGDFGGLFPSEVNPFIHQLVANGLVFQALHQHFLVLSPMVYFIHFRGTGDPVALARAAHAAVKVTGTPLPQTMPSNPTTPLHAETLGRIIGGSATVGGSGTVTVFVPRAEPIRLGGVPINPFLNVQTNVVFEPLGGSQQVAVAPDFAMTAPEINNLMRVMQAQGWMVDCLYNQETDEDPQLYFSHQVKTGNALQLAREVRRGLDQTNSRFTS